MQTSPGEHRSYLWHPPGTRVAVDTRLEIVDRLAEETVSGFEMPGRGIERGGLLLGKTRRERGVAVVEIHEIEPIESEHAAGPSLMLSAPDRHALEARMRRRKSSVVGFYRSNTRREFAVTLEDVALLSQYFSDPSNVFLLIHAVRDEPLRAGFVTWEGRAVSSKTPAHEFPLDSAMLAGRSHTIEAPAVVRVASSAPRPAIAGLPANAGWIAAGVLAIGVAAGVLYNTSAREIAPSAAKVARPANATPSAAPEQPPAPAPAPAPESQPPIEAPTTVAVSRPPLPADTSAHRAAPEPPPAARPVTPLAPAPQRSEEPPVKLAAKAPRLFTPVSAPSASSPPALADPPDVAAPSAVAPSPTFAGFVTPPPRPAAPSPAARPIVPDSKVDVAVDPVRVRDSKYRPPAPLRQPRPQIPAEIQRGLTREAIVNVRVYVDTAGKVEFAELLSDGTGANRDLAALAVFASRRWEFEPASVNGKAVPGKAVIRFRFASDGQ